VQLRDVHEQTNSWKSKRSGQSPRCRPARAGTHGALSLHKNVHLGSISDAEIDRAVRPLVGN